jgi:hypothetical protein
MDASRIHEAGESTVRRAKRAQLRGVGFGHFAREMHFVVGHHQHAPAGTRGMSGDGNGVIQIHRAVCTDRGCWPHGANEDHRLGRLDYEIQEKRGFLHRIGAVRDHGAGNVGTIDCCLHALGELEPGGVVHVLAADRRHLFDLELRQLREQGHGGNQGIGGKRGRLVPASISGILGARYRAACGKDADTRARGHRVKLTSLPIAVAPKSFRTTGAS